MKVTVTAYSLRQINENFGCSNNGDVSMLPLWKMNDRSKMQGHKDAWKIYIYFIRYIYYIIHIFYLECN